MRNISYQAYFDKVYGCWLGKSIAGTIGAPFEGRKELFEYQYDPRSIEQMLPNDDLDIQVIWLEVMEKKGIYFTSEDLADAFYHQYPFSPGEYAYFKKNYIRGIMPPVSGWFNNRYYIDGMGCPIRSEIWACVAAGNMNLAAELAKIDGVLDHGANSVEGEIFWAALEAEAFLESDLHTLIQKALKFLNPDGQMHRLLTDVIHWCRQWQDSKKVRALILEHWGHADCTNLYQNMGITLMALILGEGDFLKSAMIALNCGYDTDCTCATVGAVLGILSGADVILNSGHGFYDTGYILDALVKRRSNTLYDLAEDTCRAGLTMAKYRNAELTIEDSPAISELPHEQILGKLTFQMDYQGIPAIGVRETRVMQLQIQNNTPSLQEVTLLAAGPEDWQISLPSRLSVGPGAGIAVPVTVSTMECTSILRECNRVTVTAELSDGTETFTFGITGAAVWSVYGPFWSHHSPIPPIPYWEKYAQYFQGVDDLRDYHLNTFAEIDQNYVDESDFGNLKKNESETCSMIPKQVFLYEDCFQISDLISYQGSCVVYLVRELISDQSRTATINIGHSAPFKLWLNGKLVSESRQCDWWTAENTHTQEVSIQKGKNQLVLKAARIGENGTFSLIFNDGLFTNHHYDYASGITDDQR